MKFIQIFLALFLSSLAYSSAQVTEYQRGLEAFNGQNYEVALHCMEPYARDSNNCIAQYITGFCYSNGNVAAANDSIAEHYLLQSSEQNFGRAMGMLAVYYFNNANNDKEMTIKALVWAELAALYDPIQSLSEARDMVRKYMEQEDIENAELIVAQKKEVLDQIEPCK